MTAINAVGYFDTIAAATATADATAAATADATATATAATTTNYYHYRYHCYHCHHDIDLAEGPPLIVAISIVIIESNTIEVAIALKQLLLSRPS